VVEFVVAPMSDNTGQSLLSSRKARRRARKLCAGRAVPGPQVADEIFRVAPRTVIGFSARLNDVVRSNWFGESFEASPGPP